MRIKILRNISAAMIMIILMLSCFYAGTSVEQKMQSVSNEGTEKIAVVNLDEGVFKHNEPDEKFYYSNELLKYNSVDFDMVSLESARNGILEGRFAAYIILPADFSEKVESVNYDPEKASLTYAVNPYLNDDAKEKTIKNLESFSQDINYDISYIYVSAILRDFHDVQDSSKTILENDLADEEQLLAVDSEELIEAFMYPELRQVEREVEVLNFQELFDANNLLSNEIEEGLKSDILNGETAYQDVQSQSTTVLNASDHLQSVIESYHPGYDADGNLIYQEGILTLSENFARYNAAQEGNAENIKALARSEANRMGVLAVNKELEILQQSLSNSISLSENSYRTEYLENIIADMERYMVNVNNYYAGLGVSENNLYNFIDLRDCLEGVASPEGYKINLFETAGSISENDIAILTQDQQFSAEFTDAVDSATSVSMNDVCSIIDDQIIGELLTQQSDMQKLIRNENRNLLKEMELYNEAVLDYDPFDYIDNERLDKSLGIFKENIEKVETQQGEHDEEYWELMQEIYEVTEANQEAFDTNLQEAQEITKENVNHTIALLKESKSETTSENKDLLEDFTNKLTYTRLGSLGKVEAYDFIVSPIDFKENYVDQTILDIKSNYQHYVLVVIIILAVVTILLFWFWVFSKKISVQEKDMADNFS